MQFRGWEQTSHGTESENMFLVRPGGPSSMPRHRGGFNSPVATENDIKRIRWRWLVLRKKAWQALKQRADFWSLPPPSSDSWTTLVFSIIWREMRYHVGMQKEGQNVGCLWCFRRIIGNNSPLILTLLPLPCFKWRNCRISQWWCISKGNSVQTILQITYEHLKDQPTFLQNKQQKNQRQRSDPPAEKPILECLCLV